MLDCGTKVSILDFGDKIMHESLMAFFFGGDERHDDFCTCLLLYV